MTSTLAPTSIQHIEARIAPLRDRLTQHPLYTSIRTPAHLRLFMESHVFAVWDFMSLLKALQSRLTCVAVPWVPTPLPASRRFINEIVLGEESDVYIGRPTSHFELYLEAMHEAGASTASIDTVLATIAANPGSLQIDLAPAPMAARAFLDATFSLIAQGNVHALASAFTFGREDVIPDIFRELVRDMHSTHDTETRLGKFIWYLERHIEVDGEDHGPLSLRMVADLCGTDERLWDEAAAAAEAAILARLTLWDGILAQIQAA